MSYFVPPARKQQLEATSGVGLPYVSSIPSLANMGGHGSSFTDLPQNRGECTAVYCMVQPLTQVGHWRIDHLFVGPSEMTFKTEIS